MPRRKRKGESRPQADSDEAPVEVKILVVPQQKRLELLSLLMTERDPIALGILDPLYQRVFKSSISDGVDGAGAPSGQSKTRALSALRALRNGRGVRELAGKRFAIDDTPDLLDAYNFAVRCHRLDVLQKYHVRYASRFAATTNAGQATASSGSSEVPSSSKEPKLAATVPPNDQTSPPTPSLVPASPSPNPAPHKKLHLAPSVPGRLSQGAQGLSAPPAPSSGYDAKATGSAGDPPASSAHEPKNIGTESLTFNLALLSMQKEYEEDSGAICGSRGIRSKIERRSSLPSLAVRPPLDHRSMREDEDVQEEREFEELHGGDQFDDYLSRSRSRSLPDYPHEAPRRAAPSRPPDPIPRSRVAEPLNEAQRRLNQRLERADSVASSDASSVYQRQDEAFDQRFPTATVSKKTFGDYMRQITAEIQRTQDCGGLRIAVNNARLAASEEEQKNLDLVLQEKGFGHLLSSASASPLRYNRRRLGANDGRSRALSRDGRHGGDRYGSRRRRSIGGGGGGGGHRFAARHGAVDGSHGRRHHGGRDPDRYRRPGRTGFSYPAAQGSRGGFDGGPDGGYREDGVGDRKLGGSSASRSRSGRSGSKRHRKADK